MTEENEENPSKNSKFSPSIVDVGGHDKNKASIESNQNFLTVKKVLDFKHGLWLGIPAVIGSFIGAQIPFPFQRQINCNSEPRFSFRGVLVCYLLETVVPRSGRASARENRLFIRIMNENRG